MRCLQCLALWIAGVGATSSGSITELKSNSRGCGKDISLKHAPGQDLWVNTTSGGVDRAYRIYLHPTYSSNVPSPVILSYHGGSRNATWMSSLDGIEEEPFFNQNYIVIHPEGLDSTWEGTPEQMPGNDLLFTGDILDAVEERYCIDKTRIYATGKSNGGGFVNLAACDPKLSRRIAAFAPVAGSFYILNVTGEACHPETVALPCNPGRANIPIIEFHGGMDDTIPYIGNTTRRASCLPDIQHWAEEWARRNSLGIEPSIQRMDGQKQVFLFQWGSGNKKGLVSHVLQTDLGHSWPSTEPNLDTESKGEPPARFNASHVIMEFFTHHTLPRTNEQ